jgi:hypothetical protein
LGSNTETIYHAVAIKERLKALEGLVPGLLRIEVGIDFSRAESSADMVLCSELTNREALDEYQRHPAHFEVGQFIDRVRASRTVVGYEA